MTTINARTWNMLGRICWAAEDEGAGGAGEQPAAAEPAPEAPAAREEAPIDDGSDPGEMNEFEALLAGYDEGDDDYTPPAGAEVEGDEDGPGEPGAGEEEGGSAPEATTTPEAETAPAGEPSPAQSPAVEEPGEQPGQEPALTQEQLQERFQEAQTAQLEQLSQHYALTDEEVEELETNPKETFPKMAAKIHQNAMNAAVLQMARVVPQIIQSYNSQQQVASERTGEFYSAWPELQQHQQTVVQIGRMFRAQNPGASKEQFVDTVGKYAMNMLGLQRQPAAPATPAAPRRVAEEPFSSAAGGRRAAPAPVSGNEFEALDQMIEDIS